MRRKDNLHCSPVPSMHTFDETTRKLQRVIFSLSAHFSSSTSLVSTVHKRLLPFLLSLLTRIRSHHRNSETSLLLLLLLFSSSCPLKTYQTLEPMMASLSPLLKRRVSHLKQARESRIGSGSTGTQEQEVQEVFRSSDPRVQNPSALYMNILHVRYLSPTN